MNLFLKTIQKDNLIESWKKHNQCLQPLQNDYKILNQRDFQKLNLYRHPMYCAPHPWLAYAVNSWSRRLKNSWPNSNKNKFAHVLPIGYLGPKRQTKKYDSYIYLGPLVELPPPELPPELPPLEPP